MKFTIPIFTIICISFVSCNAQNNPPVNHNTKTHNPVTMAHADTIQELGNNIMLVHQDKKNNYWFGSWQDGLYQYDGKIIQHYTTKSGLPSNRIDEIKEDNAGNMYFNTSGGIIRYDGENFTALKVYDSNGEWKLEHDDVWFKDGWNSGHIFRYDGHLLYKLQLPKIKAGEDYILKNPNNPNPYTVYSIYKDSKGNIWFGTGALGAFRFNGKSFDWILEKDVAEIYNDPSEPSNGVRSIMEDKAGYFWFNSKFRYKVYDTHTYSNKMHDSVFYDREESIGSLDGKKGGNLIEYLSIAKDNNDELWMATYDAGIWHYDGKNINHYVVKDGTKEITLFSIYRDNMGSLWLGTQESGTYKFNGQIFERFRP